MNTFVRHTNPGWSDETLRRLKAGRREVAVGFPVGKGLKALIYPITTPIPKGRRVSKKLRATMERIAARKKSASVLDVAVWNNYGVPSRKIPARPFMNQSTPRIVAAINAHNAKIGKALGGQQLTAAQYERYYPMLGMTAQAVIQDTIVTGQYVRNAPETVRRKGSSRPLIDTATMRRSVTFSVRPRAR